MLVCLKLRVDIRGVIVGELNENPQRYDKRDDGISVKISSLS